MIISGSLRLLKDGSEEFSRESQTSIVYVMLIRLLKCFYIGTYVGTLTWSTLESYHLIFKLKKKRKAENKIVLHFHENYIVNKVRFLCFTVLYNIVTRNATAIYY